MVGKIFDIQRFSIYDGQGIRTNVFLKGCNLRCLWCHNPESQSRREQLLFYEGKCTGCGKCREVCGKIFTDECTACGKCVDVCTHGARKISGRTASVDEALEIVLKDKEYYITSGGGVTLSGGEPLLQADFCAELLKKCKANGISTNIETAAAVSWDCFEKVLPYLDCVMCDIKCIDDEKHRRFTGISNELILENAKKLKASGVKVIFRTPVIPGYNVDEVKSIAEFCAPCEYELLAYHKTGCDKYSALGKEYSLADVEPPTAEFMYALADSVNAKYSKTGI